MTQTQTLGEVPLVQDAPSPWLPLPGLYYVRVLEPPTTLPSGLVLPDGAAELTGDAEVLAVGEGRVYDNGVRSVPWAFVGDRALIDRRTVRWVGTGKEATTGFIREEDLIATLDPDREDLSLPPRLPGEERAGGPIVKLVPCNDWVLVEPDPQETHRGGLLIPEDARTAPRSGRVLMTGNGRIRASGAYAGSRQALKPFPPGTRVHWAKGARTYDAWSDEDRAGSRFVKHEDLIAVEEAECPRCGGGVLEDPASRTRPLRFTPGRCQGIGVEECQTCGGMVCPDCGLYPRGGVCGCDEAEGE